MHPHLTRAPSTSPYSLIQTPAVLPSQASGSGGFKPLLDDTRSPHPIVHLSSLSEATWYEFKVIALNAAGRSPVSLASQV